MKTALLLAGLCVGGGVFVRSAEAAIPISSCQDITAPGSYVVTQDLSNTGTICIKIHDTRNVQLDCQGHSITSTKSNGALVVMNAQNFSVTGCTLRGTIITNNKEAIWPGLNILSGTDGVVTGNPEIRGVYVGWDQLHANSSNIQILNNTLTDGLQMVTTHGCLIQNNLITMPREARPGAIDISAGANNRIIGNRIDGGWDGILGVACVTWLEGGGLDLSRCVGADDGIILNNESGVLVKSNYIMNAWDTGIETVGLITGSEITENTIKAQGFSGIGGWYSNSWRDNKVSKNVVQDAPLLFFFERYYALQPGEQNIYFENNMFNDNTLSLSSEFLSGPHYYPTAPSLHMDMSRLSLYMGGDGTLPPGTWIVKNNTLARNDLTLTMAQPSIAPMSMAVDGGGNICQTETPGDSNPLVCHAPLGAVFVAPQQVPLTMTPGQTYPVQITMKNTSAVPWTSNASFRLSSQNPKDNAIWGVSRVTLEPGESIAPDATKTFSFNVTAPTTPGTYNFQWRMVQEGVAWFGESTPNRAISVNVPILPPTVSSQSITVPFNTAVSVLLRGADPQGLPLTYWVVQNPRHGTLSGTVPNLTYTPDPGYKGPDLFLFRVNNGYGDSPDAVVGITVEASPPEPPLVEPQSSGVPFNKAQSITLSATDPAGLTLTYRVTINPSHGALSGTAPTLTYTPNAGFVGSDVFTFKANNGFLDSAPATFTLTVNGPETPTAAAQTVAGEAGQATPLTLSATDPNGLPLTYALVEPPLHGTITGALPHVIYTPLSEYAGPDHFTFKANNGSVDSNIATVSITVGSGPALAAPDISGINGRTYTLHDTISLNYEGSAKQFNWDFLPAPSGHQANSIRRMGYGTRAPVATNAPRFDLRTLSLQPGPYTVRVQAVNGGRQSSWVSANITMVGDDLAAIRVRPNPWRFKTHGAAPVTFDNLPAGSTIKIFTADAKWVKTLTFPNNAWDLTNDSGDRVASGIYLYLIASDGQKKTGQIVVIK